MSLMENVDPCKPPKLHLGKCYPYQEYYRGERDEEQRKKGVGSINWSGAESLECYTGRLLRDTMHGIGEYRSRHRDETKVGATYEGHFYNNYMHGYGVTSHPDGQVFCGLFHSNLRWGPGVETAATVREDVGIWKGNKLVRLAWRPNTASVVPDLLSTNIGREIVAQNRSLLTIRKRTVSFEFYLVKIGETNPALELLKKYGADPLAAQQKWQKLYPKSCTDEKSQFFYADVFDRAYYDNEIVSLEDYKPENAVIENQGEDKTNSDAIPECQVPEISKVFYAWNNNKMLVHMMKHCYQHENQRASAGINLDAILNGPRISFKPANYHEMNCRILLLSCYLGYISYVAALINEHGVSPNVTDMQGNSAVMYAACGYHPVITHFLVGAGARVNDYNDGCCTPLGAVLIYYTCTQLSIPAADMMKSIIPSSFPKQKTVEKVEWKIDREWVKSLIKEPEIAGTKPMPKQKKNVAENAKKTDQIPEQESNGNLELPGKESQNQLYANLLEEFHIKVYQLFFSTNSTTRYIFEVKDVINEVKASMTYIEEPKKVLDGKLKKTKTEVDSNVILELKKLERDLSASSVLNKKDSELSKSMMSTITQLLSDGADPRRVYCPKPALFLAVVSQDSDLIRSLIKHGANANEPYSDVLGYTPLDIAVSRPLTIKNANVICALVEGGAKPNHRLPVQSVSDSVGSTSVSEEGSLGPTLLHVILAKDKKDDMVEIRQVVELFLAHGADPLAQYEGRSAMDMAMSKSTAIFNIFIESPNTDLNGVINKFNQSILMKMFQPSFCRTIYVALRRQMLTNLLLIGADPLLKCQYEENEYDNLFVYAKQVLLELEKANAPRNKLDPNRSKLDSKTKKQETKSSYKGLSMAQIADEINDYGQTLSLVTNCVRLLFIRWIQTKLTKELIIIVDRFKYRHWNMILKEYKNGNRLGLWLSPVRCLEIWDILQTTNKRIYNDKTIKKHVLCIVVFYFKNTKKLLRWAVSSEDKASIESEVAYFIREHKMVAKVQDLKRPYVVPELTPTKEIGKYKICFECALPLTAEHVLCIKCELVSFCSRECMRTNIERDNCHPCSSYLKMKYFSTPDLLNDDEAELENVIYPN